MGKTTNFKIAIEDHLRLRAFTDPLFAKTLKKKGKNIDDCIKYILNTVKKSKQEGFEDSEIFKMAVHYYDEDKIDIGGDVNVQIVINRKVHLTEEEIADAKKKAIDDVILEQRDKMLKKPKRTKKTPVEEVKEEENIAQGNPTLDFES